MSNSGEGQIVTNDLSLAAFLSMRGLPLTKAERGRKGIYIFAFRDRRGIAEDLKIEFANSCCAQYEAAMKRIKTILHSGDPAKGRGNS